MFCRFCATSNPEGATHCRACSAPLSTAPPAAEAGAPFSAAAPSWAAPPAASAPVPAARPYAEAEARGQQRTLAQIVAARGGALSEAESLRYVEAVARALAQELGRGRAPRSLDPERIVVQADGGIALHLEWQDIGQSPRAIESHLAYELEHLSQLLRGQASGSDASARLGSANAAPATGAAHDQNRAGGEASARARLERVSFFDTAREMVRGALTPFAPPLSSAPQGPRPGSSASSSAGSSAPPTARPAAANAQNAATSAAAASTNTNTNTNASGSGAVNAAAASTSSAPAPHAAAAPRKEVAPVLPPVRLDFDKVKAQIVRSWARGTGFSKLAFGRDGREVWAVDSEGSLSVWNVESGNCAARMEARFRGAAVCSVAFLAREEMVATGHEDGRLCLWLPRANRLRASLEAHAGRASALCFAATTTGRTRLFSGGGDGTLRAWDALEGKAVGGEVEVTLLNVREASAAPDGERVALGGDGGRIEVWRHAAARLEWSAALHEFWITALAFSPDGRVLASGGYDRAVRLWSGASGALGREFKVHESFVSALRWAPHSDLLFSLSCDGALWAHDWKGSRSRQLASEEGLQDFVLHPDGRHFAAASRDGLSLWRLE